MLEFLVLVRHFEQVLNDEDQARLANELYHTFFTEDSPRHIASLASSMEAVAEGLATGCVGQANGAGARVGLCVGQELGCVQRNTCSV